MIALTTTPWGSIPPFAERSALARQYAWYLETHFLLARKYRTVSAVSVALLVDQEMDYELDFSEDMDRDDSCYNADAHDGRAMRELSRTYVAELCDSGVTHTQLMAILRAEISARRYSCEWSRIWFKKWWP
jgi:hypothetical protein